MKISISKSVFASALLLLAACGGEVGGGGPVAITPTYADSAADTISAKSTTEGLTGLIARSDFLSTSASTASAKIVLSADFTQATVYINGVNAGTITETNPGLNTASSGLYASGQQTMTGGGLANSYYGIYYYTDGTNIGHMIAGVETRAANLPAAQANYQGIWQVSIGTIGGDTGFSDFDVDFAAGTFTGVLSGGAVVNATITGVVAGNGLEGTAAFAGAYGGNATYFANFYGPVGNDLAGVLSGTLTATSGGAGASVHGNVYGTLIP